MGKLEKLLLRIKNNPKTVRFTELEKVCSNYGFEKRQPSSGSSHYIFKKDGFILCVPRHKTFVKRFYVEQLLKWLEDNGR
jgi:hypothetical protein